MIGTLGFLVCIVVGMGWRFVLRFIGQQLLNHSRNRKRGLEPRTDIATSQGGNPGEPGPKLTRDQKAWRFGSWKRKNRREMWSFQKNF